MKLMAALSPNRNIEDLSPECALRVKKFLNKCKAAGLDIFVTEGRRSKARQLYLWSFGRNLNRSFEVAFLGYDDPDIIGHPDKKQLTKTLQSNHISGNAIDIAFKGELLYPRDMKLWNKVYDIAEECGLSSLYRRTGYHDLPHIEYLSPRTHTNSAGGRENRKHWGKKFEDILVKMGVLKDRKNLDEPPTRAEVYKIAVYAMKKRNK